MRAILVDWIIEVHWKYKLNAETLFITINLIDRYLERTPTKRDELQLVGITAMLIASKNEDYKPPSVEDFSYITDNAYTPNQILQMEHKILTAVNFELNCVSPYIFL